MTIYRRSYRSSSTTTTKAATRTTPQPAGKVRVVPPTPPVVEATPSPDVPGDTAPGPEDVAQDTGSTGDLAADEVQPPKTTSRSRKASTAEEGG